MRVGEKRTAECGKDRDRDRDRDRERQGEWKGDCATSSGTQTPPFTTLKTSQRRAHNRHFKIHCFTACRRPRQRPKLGSERRVRHRVESCGHSASAHQGPPASGPWPCCSRHTDTIRCAALGRRQSFHFQPKTHPERGRNSAVKTTHTFGRNKTNKRFCTPNCSWLVNPRIVYCCAVSVCGGTPFGAVWGAPEHQLSHYTTVVTRPHTAVAVYHAQVLPFGPGHRPHA